MKATLNKIFSVLLAVCFVLSAIPAPAAAAEIPTSSTTNGYYNGNDWVEGGNGSTTHTIEGTEVSLSKTAVPVAGMENTFDITLQVKTSTTTSVETASGAVVLVIDTSGSMAYCSECGTDFIHNPRCPYFISSFWGNDVTRLDAAQDAAYTFLQTYAGTDANASRMLAIVSFASGSEIKLNWVNVAGGAGKNSFDAAVNAIYSLHAEGGTNLDAGLKKAHDLMQQSAVVGIESKSVVALTDGAPTQSLTAGNGTSGSDTINTHTKAQAGNVKSLATLYTIGFGVANQTTHSGGPTVNAFLAEVASTGKAYTAENRSELFGAFAAITQDITSGLTGEGWTATDPMADMITVTGGTGANFSGVDGTYTWKLSNPETVTEGSTTKYVYSHTYRVTLNVQGENFKEGKFFPTNEPTYLNVGDAQYAFPVPGVKGVLPRTDVTVTKVWKDAENQDGKRTESVTVQLKQGENLIGEKVTLDASNNWTYTWDGETYNLISHINNQPIAYTVVEDKVAGYTPAVTSAEENPFALTLTNTHEIEKTSVTMTKVWNDANNQDGKRPASITVNLMDGKEVVKSAEVTPDANGNWTYEFKDLPKYRAGKVGELIGYTVEEAPVEGYTASYEGSNITNTHAPETTTVSGSKTWDDNNNQDGKRPESITVNLMDGKEVVKSMVVTPDANGNWNYEFKDLPKYRAGKVGELIVYSVEETPVEGYTASYEGTNITNTHAPEKTSVTVTKVWNDNDNQDGIRPKNITVHLMNGETKVAEATFSGTGNTWTYEFTNVDKYENGGDEIVYTVKEIDVPDDYKSDVNGLTITNTYVPKTTSVTVTKEWDHKDNEEDKLPEEVTVRLMANGVEQKEIKLNAENKWTYTFENLPENAGGEPISYTVTEDTVTDYTNDIEKDENGNFIITNTYDPAKISITFTKAWEDANNQDGKRPDKIKVELLADGKKVKTIELTAKDEWTTKIDIKKMSGGKDIVYTIKEVAVEGYTSVITGDQNKGFTITNTHEPEMIEKIVGQKIWDDGNNQDGKRPESITVKLKANGDVIKTVTVTAENNWLYTFENLPKFDNGEEIAYTVEEAAVEGYKTSYDGYKITNTYSPEEINIKVTKSWVDSNDADKIRPTKVTIYLLANGEKTGDKLVLTAGDKWTGSFTDLPKYEDGKEIKYTIEEKEVKDYKASIKGSAEDGFTVTNSLTTIPKTGDERTPILWISMMALGIIAVFFATRPFFVKKGKYSR